MIVNRLTYWTRSTGERTANGTASPDFRLLVSLANRIFQSGQVLLAKALREKHLGSAEANVLMFLYTNGDGVKQDDIVSGVEVSKPAISRTVASLVEKGYLVRKRGDTDRRSRLVFLTDKARREQGFVESKFAEMVAVASEGVPQAKVAEFIEVFGRVAGNLEACRKGDST